MRTESPLEAQVYLKFVDLPDLVSYLLGLQEHIATFGSLYFYFLCIEYAIYFNDTFPFIFQTLFYF